MKLDRRSFLRKSAVAGAIFAAAPFIRTAPPGRKFRTALIGCGWWGKNILKEAMASGRCQTVALADVDATALEVAADQVNGLSGDTPKTYKDYRELLAREKPEIVIIATPDHWHALNTIAASLIGVLTTMASDAQLRDLTFWSLGSLADIRWSVVTLLGPLLMLCMVWLIRRWRTFNALLLGEREALHLGWSVERLRRQTIFAVALMVGPLVAATGGIAFVGLVVPHIMRLLLGADHRCLLPASLLGGAVALTAADTLARVAVAPAELPIGLVTSLVGGPFFLWLLLRRRS